MAVFDAEAAAGAAKARQVRQVLASALVLALGAAVSLGLARFSYALLLPPMRADLGWTYFTAGAMNALNAAGYLAGALAAPRLLARWGARRAFVGGALAAAVLLALHGLARSDAALYVLRAATGAASAATFVSGGLMAARLGSQLMTPLGAQPAARGGITPGLVLGLYYGGTGLGIVVSAAVVPWLAAAGWPVAWQALGVVALALALLMAWRTPMLDGPAATPGQPTKAFRVQDFAFALAGYFMFGLGYIGYMTFIVTLLREQALSTGTITAFYSLLGVGVMASPWLWAGLLQHHRDGQPLARLNALLALATALPVLWAHPAVAFLSGALFGAVFLSVVAATTALVRHNLPPAGWAKGISAFTIVFAFGQIVGPGLVGALADGPGGLVTGLAVSAAALLLGAVLATRQRALNSA